MHRAELVCWMLFAGSAFALFFPHLAAGEFEDAGPLRLMALALFLLTGTALADDYLFNSALFRSIARF
jgi:hypothetical protein